MSPLLSRRSFTLGASLVLAFAKPQAVLAQQADVWTAQKTHEALKAGEVVLIDIRSRDEWMQSGVAEGAWPISMHEPKFAERLFAAKAAADGRPVALICATGGRTGSVMRALRRGGYEGFIDVSEGMMGRRGAGQGWIRAGLPRASATDALNTLPPELR